MRKRTNYISFISGKKKYLPYFEWCIALFILTITLNANAQEPFQVTGKFIIDQGSLDGAEITVTKDDSPFTSSYPEKAKFFFNLEYNSSYVF